MTFAFESLVIRVAKEYSTLVYDLDAGTVEYVCGDHQKSGQKITKANDSAF